MSLFRAQPRYADGDHIEVAGARVRLKVSGRASRVSLRLDATRGEVVATAPNSRRLGEAAAFAMERRAWIAAQMARVPDAVALRPGSIIEVLGRPIQLLAAPGRLRWRPADETQTASLTVSGEGDAFARAVLRALKAEAKRVLSERTEVHAQSVGKAMPAVSLTDARARWGSCKPPRRSGFGAAAEVGQIRYSWRLVLSPAPVLDYVAAHEVAHLIEANHSPRFWAVVKTLVGDHRPHRDWLKAHGPRLHAFGRDDS